MNAYRESAIQLIDSGVVPISLYPGTKKPRGEGWQLQTMPTAAQLVELWPDDEPRNVGALMGQISGNAFSPDFDIYAAFARWRSETKPPETRTIYTARSTRPIYRTDPEALFKAKMVIDGATVGEMLADGQHVVMPPSRLSNGFEYTDNGLEIAYLAPDHPGFLTLRKWTEKAYVRQELAEIAQGKRKVARFANAALEGRIPVGLKSRFASRSELDAALIQSLARSGFDADEIYNMLDKAVLRSHWHGRKEKSRRDDIDRVTSKFANTNSKISQEAIKRADALADLRQSHTWGGFIDTGKTKVDKDTGEIKPVRVMGGTVEAVLLAHETKVRDCLNYTYQLDVRAGDGRFANVARKSFERANRIIVERGYIAVAKKAKGTCATVYRVPEVKALKELANTTNSAAMTHFNTTGGGRAHQGVEVGHSGVISSGAFDYSGLGRSAFLVYRTALDEPMTVKDIAARTGLSVRTVRPQLAKLARYGLVEKRPGRRWQSDATVNWQAVGDFLNTTQRIAEKQERTRADRQARANSYKHHDPQRAAHTADRRADKSLGDVGTRAKVKAVNNVNRYGAKFETQEAARTRADLSKLQEETA